MKLRNVPNPTGYGRDYQCVFGGLNENLSAQDGEICAMENMTSDHYPLLSPRAKRRLVRTLTAPHGMAARDRLCWADGTVFYYDGAVKGSVSAGEKRFCFINKWIVIWPDKLCYNTATDELSPMEASVASDTGSHPAAFSSAPSPGGVSSERNCLTVTGVTMEGVFRPGDAVEIAGCAAHPENNQTLVVREVAGSSLYFYDNSFTLDDRVMYTVGKEGLAAGYYNFEYNGMYYYFELTAALSIGDTVAYAGHGVKVTQGGAETTVPVEGYGAFGDAWLDMQDVGLDYTETAAVTVSRSVPDLDFLCECDNRLWGVKDSTVWCSYLGEPRVWHNFDGTAASCWSVEVGSGGAFTGAYAYGGYPLLFKEDHIYRVYGTKPSNFQLMDTETLGCEAGSEKSFAVVGQTLYYKSRAGFAAYAGGVPTLIDSALGVARRTGAVAGTDGRKYYVSVSDGGSRSLYVYDTILSVWHREDALNATDFAWCGGELYMLCADGKVWQTGRIRAAAGTPEDTVKSAVEFAGHTGGTLARKTLSRIYFRVQTEGVLALTVSYDGGPWREVGCVFGEEKGLQTLQLVPRRCDSFRVRLEGEGDWKLWAVSREYNAGSMRG